jgi:hypothetical protein
MQTGSGAAVAVARGQRRKNWLCFVVGDIFGAVSGMATRSFGLL